MLSSKTNSVASNQSVRVLYSFPHKLGADRICYTAWQQVNGLAKAGAEVLCMPGVLHRAVPESVSVRTTLAWGKLRVSYKLLGAMRALTWHDHIIARRLSSLVGKIDLIHTWPDAARETLIKAAQLGIPTVLERPNAHTRYAYEAVQAEANRIGVMLPPDNEYTFKSDVLSKEEEEYELADFLLCPSDFTIKTFVERGIPNVKLKKHIYGFDPSACRPDPLRDPRQPRGLDVLFAGDAAVRKGVHLALEAWIKSPASQSGTFRIAGNLLPSYAAAMSELLAHPSVHVLGYRNDVPELMRSSDLFVLPSIEEGFGLVCVEAMGCGAVPLVSEACTDTCRHMDNALVHPIGDIEALRGHFTLLHQNREQLARMRARCLEVAPMLTWEAAGVRLLEIYREVICEHAQIRQRQLVQISGL